MVRVRIFYPADPVGVVPGGIDTFIRGIIKAAPDDVVISLVGMSTDPVQRPVGVWTTCHAGDRTFEFFPVVAVADAGKRGKLPLSVRFMAGVWRYQAFLHRNFDVFDYHRIEPMFQHAHDPRPKSIFFHQDPDYLKLAASDNLWRRLPAGYQWLEKLAMRHVDSLWCVRESGVRVLRDRYPALGQRARFVPTWVDASVFWPVDEPARQALRQRLAQQHGLPAQAQWVISVGRLDTQKNPQRLLAAVAQLARQGLPVHWLVVGDGVLQPEVARLASQAGIADRVHFLGLMAPAEIAQCLRASDLFAMSSAYEGMPMALLEALGCGLPTVVTDVGEIRRVVRDGINGVIATEQTDECFTQALAKGLALAPTLRGAAATESVEAYQPEVVLAPVYDNYRALARAYRRSADGGQAWPYRRVIGISVHNIERKAAVERIMGWARALESRYVCFCNAHSAVLASTNTEHQRALSAADLVAPDGAPIAWTLSMKTGKVQERLDGPGLMLQLCKVAASQGVRIGLLGSTTQVLKLLTERLKQEHPKLDIAYTYSPPFRALSEEEDQVVCQNIAQAGVGLLFVGLGCPKQETWMREHRHRIPAVMLGVGAAFDFHAGTVSRAPNFMRAAGLEWLHRLVSEPRRLWWRYLSFNTVFVSKSAIDLGRVVARRLRGWLSHSLSR
jgi:exopolysaccharide biosynthesis WecB/TagA/CpsF family protein